MIAIISAIGIVLTEAMSHSAVVALLVGLLLGLERERSQRGDGERPFAGIRTFPLLSLAGYVAALKAYDDAFAKFFTRLAADGITAKNTLFVFTADEAAVSESSPNESAVR